MSTEIDNHIVQMELRNSQFEKNANQTISTLDELKKKLNFDNVSKGFDQLDAASKKISLAHLSNSLDTIASRFTNLGIIGVTALQNIANTAINAGKVMVKSLTMDPIAQGFGEYQLKMGAIQTIQANTGKGIDKITAALDKLNQYADKTIYNYGNMIDNAKKFVNAGVDLDDATLAVQGISNAAAHAGADANEAARAMYNLSQAMSVGYVQLIDWKSVEYANVGSARLKQELVDTAKAMGTLVEKEGKLYTTTTNANQAVGEFNNVQEAFKTGLQYQWLTSDVLLETMKRYGDETTEIGKEAMESATKVKTFTMLMDSLKESVGSGWAKTWELVIGDLDEATTLWTRVNKSVDKFVGNISDARNTFLATWKEFGGRTAAIESIANLLNVVGNGIKSVSNGFKEIFPDVSAKNVANAFKMFENITKSIKISDKTLENVKQTAKGFFSVFSIGYNIIKPFASALLKLAVYIIPSIGSAFLSVTGSIGKVLSSIDKLVKETKIFSSIANFLETIFGNLFYPIKLLFDTITDGFSSLNGIDMTGVKHVLTNVAKWLDSASVDIDKWFGSAREAVSDFISYVKTLDLGPLNDFVDDVKNMFSIVAECIQNGLGEAYNYIKNFVNSIQTSMQEVGDTDVSGVTKFVEAVKKALGPFSGIVDFFQAMWDKAQEIYNKVSPKIISAAKMIWGELNNLASAFADGVKNLDFGSFNDLLNTGLIGLVLVKLKKLAKSVASLSGKQGVSGVLESVKIVFQSLSNTIKEFQNSIKSNTILKIGIAIGMLAASIIALSAVDTQSLSDSLGAVIVLMTSLTAATSGINSVTESKASKAIIKMSIAMLILSKAIADLSEIEPGRLLPTVLAVAAALGALAGVYSLVAFAQSDLEDSQADGALGPLKALVKGLTSAVKTVGTILALGAALKSLAIAIGVLTAAIVVLGNMDNDKFLKGILGVGTMLGALLGILALTKKVKASSAKTLISLAFALTALAVPIAAFQFIGWDAVAKGFTTLFGGVAVLAALAWAVSLYWDKTAKKMPDVMKGLMEFGVVMIAFAVAMRIVSSVPWQILLGTLGAIPILLDLMGLAMRALPDDKKISNLASAMVKIGAAFGIFVIGLGLLVPALIGFQAVNFEEIAKGFFLFVGVVGAIGLMAAMFSSWSDDMLKLTGAFMMFGAAIALLSLFAPMINENADEVVRALDVLVESACMVIIGSTGRIVEAVMTLISALLDGLAKGIPMIANSLGDFIMAILEALDKQIPRIVPKAMETLSLLMTEIVDAAKNSPMGAVALVAITTITVAFTKLFKQLKELSKDAKDGIKGAAAIALCIVEIGGAISLIAWIGTFSDLETILSITVAIISTAIVFSKIFDNLAKLSKQVGDAIVGALGVGAVIAVIGTVIGILAAISKDTPPDILLAFAASISAVLIAAAVAMKLLNGMDVKKGIEAVAVLMFAVMGITAVVALLGMYADKVLGPEFEDTFNGAISLMTKLGQAIGGLVGGLYGGVIEGAGTGAAVMIVQISQAMVSLGEGLSNFFNSLSGVSIESVGVAAAMVAIIAEITNAELRRQIVDWIAEDPVDSFVASLEKLAPGLKTFADNVKEIKNTDVAGAVTVGRMLPDLIEAIPTESIFGALFTGTTDYSKFAEGMGTIGDGIVKFADAVLDIDTSGVSDAIKAGNDIADFIDGFESLVVGGAVGLWSGEVNYTNFANNIKKVGEGIVGFADEVKNINGKAVTAGTRAGKAIGGFIDNFDSLKVGGIIQDIFGETNYEDFIENLPKMGTAIKDFGDKTDGLKEQNVNAAVSAGETITGFAETLQNKGGVISWFIGNKTTLGEFATDLDAFTTSLSKFTGDAATMDPDKMNNVAYLLYAISSLLTTLDNTGLGDFEDLSESLRNVGGLGIEEFVNGFKNSYDELYTAVVSYLTAIYKAIDDCSPNVEKYTTMCFANVKAKIDDSTPYFEESAQSIINAFAAAIEDPNDYILTSINNLFEKVFTGMTDESSEMAKRNTSYGATMVAYIGDGVYSMWTTLSNQLYNTVSQAIAPLSEEGSDFQKSARKIGTNAATWITNGILESSSPIKSSLHDTFTSLARALQEDETVKSPYKALGSKLLEFVTLGITSNYLTIKEAMSSTISSVYQDGLNTTEALKKGVTRGLPSVSDSGKAIGDTMLRSFDRVMEIHSPPRTMIKRGELIPEGTAIGIRKKLKVATDAFDDMAKSELNTYDTAVKKRSSQSTQTYSEYWDEMRKTAEEGIKDNEDQSLDDLTGMGKHQAITQQIAQQGKEDGKAYTDSLGREIQNETKTVVNSTDELVLQVIRGEWGNGIDRINRLTAAGYNYRAVQDKVNEALGYMSKASAETTAAMAKNNEQALADSFFDPEEIKKQTDVISSAGTDAYSQLAIDNASAMTSSIESSVNSMMSDISLDSFNVDTNSIISQVTEGFNSANFDMSQYMDFSNIDSESVLNGMFGGGNIDISQFFNFSNLGSSITSSINTQDLDLAADLKLNPIVDMDALNRQLSGVNLYIPGNTTMGPTPQPKSRRASFGVNTSWGRLAATLNGDRQKVNTSERPVGDNTAVVNAINDVKTELQSLSDRMSSLEVVLDDRTLIGKITPKLDRALGVRVTRARRSV